MPTKREREYYAMGFRDGRRYQLDPERGRAIARDVGREELYPQPTRRRTTPSGGFETLVELPSRKPKRKLSAWNKYVKNKRNHITYRDGKLNLKKMAVAFRRKKRR